MNKKKFIVVYTTFPNLKIAKKIIRALVREKLCACGNIFQLKSIYVWRRKTEDNPEYGALIKTRSDKYQLVQRYILEHHPYEVPAIISWPIARGLPAYLTWIQNSTK